MAWESELKDATYTSPSGTKYTFNYDSKLQTELELKTASFTFPSKNGALVVPLGYGGRKFAMTCIFFGEKCSEEAGEFEEALKETGIGELEHPLYGTHKVVPTGSISRSDDVVSGVGISEISVTFSETLIGILDFGEAVKQDDIENAMDDLGNAIESELKKDLDTSTTSKRSQITERLKSISKSIMEGSAEVIAGVGRVAGGVSEIAKKSRSVYTKVQSTYAELERTVGNVVEGVTDIAALSVTVCRLPSQIAISAFSKIEGYSVALKSIIDNFKDDPFGKDNAKNSYVTSRMAVQSLVASMASGIALSSTSEGDVDSPASASPTDAGSSFYNEPVNKKEEKSNLASFTSRDQAIEVAEKILEWYEKVQNFLKEKQKKNFVVETGEAESLVRDIIYKSIYYIVNQAFSLPTRKVIKLKADRQVTELVVELYGNYDRLDEFIIDNNLTYDEIELIPMGREVAYYV